MCIKNYYIIIFYREFRNLISCKIMRINERFVIVDTCYYTKNTITKNSCIYLVYDERRNDKKIYPLINTNLRR